MKQPSGQRIAVLTAELTALRASNERLHDLVRYKRSELHEDGLISDEEYAELLTKQPGAVKRLEGYDAAIAKLKASHADEINYYKDEVHDLSHKIDQLQQDNLKLMEYGTTLKVSHADEMAKARSDGYDKAHSKWMVDYGIKCSQLIAAEADLATFKASHAKQSYFEWTEDSVRLFLKANKHSPNLMAKILNDYANRLWVLAQSDGYDKAHSKWMVDYGIKCSQLAVAQAELVTLKASQAG